MCNMQSSVYDAGIIVAVQVGNYLHEIRIVYK